MPTKHALLGASSAHRWLHCPPSAKWSLDFPETGHNEAAEEGTLAHSIAETFLRAEIADERPRSTVAQRRNPLYRPAMEEHVLTYTDYVVEHLIAARQRTKDATLLVEERVDFSRWVPGGFGTADALLIADGVLQVFDLKYGKGVSVSAVGNPQIRLYALGAYEAYGLLYGITSVVMHIVQPRLDSITSEEMTLKELLHWGDGIWPIARQAAKGEGKLSAGDWCVFCPCRNVCRELAEKNLAAARLQFDEVGEERNPNALTREEIAQILSTVDGLVRWASGVKEYAQQEAVENGATFPGFKLVEGRSNRQITDTDKALQALEAAGVQRDQVVTTKLKGLTELENLLGRKALGNILGDLLVKPKGKPTLVPESDTRKAFDYFEEE